MSNENTTTDAARDAGQQYQFRCNEDGGTEVVTARDMDHAKELAEDWMKGGEWGTDGARVGVTVTPLDEDGEEMTDAEEYLDVEIEPDHEAKIKDAVGRYNLDSICGTDPDDHDWTSDGEGGCSENPGVWGLGGTAMSFASHCRKCGLHRSEHGTGSQRNPGEHDTVEYRMLDEDEIASHRANGDMDENPEADREKWVEFLRATSYDDATAGEISEAWGALFPDGDASEIEYPAMWERLQTEIK